MMHVIVMVSLLRFAPAVKSPPISANAAPIFARSEIASRRFIGVAAGAAGSITGVCQLPGRDDSFIIEVWMSSIAMTLPSPELRPLLGSRRGLAYFTA